MSENPNGSPNYLRAEQEPACDEPVKQHSNPPVKQAALFFSSFCCFVVAVVIGAVFWQFGWTGICVILALIVFCIVGAFVEGMSTAALEGLATVFVRGLPWLFGKPRNRSR